MRIGMWCALVVAFGLSGGASAGEYQASRAQDAPFAFTSMFGGTFNKGSALMRETILLNDPDAPVQVTRTRTRFELVKSNFDFVSTNEFEARKPIAAVAVHHIVFDVFGRHMDDLSAIDVADRGVGRHSRDGRWRSLGDYVPELLTTVTYVSRVRLSDGTQWAYDQGRLIAALRRLGLEPIAGDGKRSEAPQAQ